MSRADNFHIQLSLARMAVGLCGRHKDDLGVPGTVWQVERLAQSYRDRGEVERAEKLQRLVDWFKAGTVVSDDMVVLSET